MAEGSKAKQSGRWKWLLILPFIGLLWVPFYNANEPRLWGFPFFYWYQFLWLLITCLVTFIVHWKTNKS